MKYLQDYQDKAQSALFKKTGSFFAFSNEQFEEAKKEGVKYVNCKHGLICPEENVKELINGIDSIYKGAIKKDLKENGIEAIILRELYNHECFYTGDYSSALDAVESYGITEEQVKHAYIKESQKQNV